MKPDKETPSKSKAGEILRARGRALARPPEKPTTEESLLQVLEFRLARERYAVEARFVGEVHALADLTPLPCTPPFVLGIVNVRGRIVPVVDLKKFFVLPESGLTDLHCVIVVRNGDVEFGLLADAIAGVTSVPVEGLQSSLPTLTGIRGDYMKGVTADRLIVLDMARILADPNIIVHEDVAN